MTAAVLRQIPNVITVVRVLLVVPTTWYLIESEYLHALVLMAVAGASDAVDGWLARRFDWITRFGATLDPMADKILVGVLFIALTVQGKLPLWVASIAIARDVVIVGGATAYRILFKHIEVVPTLLSKANTALQIVMLLLLLFSLCGFETLSPIARAVNDPYGYWIVSALAIASGVDYVVTWSKRAAAESAAQRATRS